MTGHFIVTFLKTLGRVDKLFWRKQNQLQPLCERYDPLASSLRN
jgi:hypothetical protein